MSESAAEATAEESWTDLPAGSPPATYQLTRFVILRLLGAVYLVAFLVFINQGLPLLGHDGLTPVDRFVHDVAQHFGSRTRAFFELPSLFWAGVSDTGMRVVAWVGAILSLLVALGLADGIALAVLWALYMSIVHVGQIWYGYGWENQLLETGFLAIFLCPLLDPRPFPKRPAPVAIFYLFRWLTFRIMLGAGLIKLRGDPCWRELTCLDFHYLTQPIPSPLSPLFHAAPHWFHALGVVFNHVCELIAPWFAFGPRLARHIAGGFLVAFQLMLILSGNLSFLNWLTLIPILACFDDNAWGRLIPSRWREWVASRCERQAGKPHRVAVGALVALVGVLSIPPVMNLFSSHQRMNTGHEPFELVNSYGAFGTVGKERSEIIFEGTSDPQLSDATQWKPYEFNCKPGDPNRRPCLISPYHYRLDWQVWFAAMENVDEEPWFVHLVWKLLHNDPGALSLLAGNPFPDAPPRFIRAELYQYQFAPRGSGAWWTRTYKEEWLPPLSVSDPRLREFLQAYGWGAP
jgi:hypothetical protein